MGPPIVRQFHADEWSVYRQLRLAALAESPEAFGSLLEYEEPRKGEEWAGRLRAGVESKTDLPLIVEIDQVPSGLAWGRVDPEDDAVAFVYQMWVAPDGRGVGAGEALLRTIVRWATKVSARELRLSVTCGNNSAYRLYSRVGFVPMGPPEPLRPGSDLQSQTLRLVLKNNG